MHVKIVCYVRYVDETDPVPRAGAGSQMSFALYAAASRMIRMHKPFLEPVGLTFPQYLVMLELFDDSPRTVGGLGKVLGMEGGTVTPLLKRIENAGLIVRRRDPADERRVSVELTDAGVSMQTEILQVAGKIQSACALSDYDLVRLRETLDDFARPVDG